jgi:hypothetical protein
VINAAVLIFAVACSGAVLLMAANYLFDRRVDRRNEELCEIRKMVEMALSYHAEPAAAAAKTLAQDAEPVVRRTEFTEGTVGDGGSSAERNASAPNGDEAA